MMEVNEVKQNQGLINFINSVDGELGRDEDSLNLFEWVVEDHFDEVFNQNREYFIQRPEMLHLSNEKVMWELESMLEYFVEKEEYEKCARLKNLKEQFFKKIKEFSTID